MKKLMPLVFLIAGCTAVGLQPATTFPEQVAYIEAGIQGAIKTLAANTCGAYTQAGTCTEPSRTLHPARSMGYLGQLRNARIAVKDAGSVPFTDCLGLPSTPAACLSLAGTMLAEIEKILADVKKGRP